MPFTTLNLGLELTIPVNGTVNWGTTLYNTTWTKISNHNHTGSGDGNQMVTGSYADNSITTVKLSKNYGYTQATTLIPAGTTQTIDWDNGNVQVLDLDTATGDVTITFSNETAGSKYLLFTVQGATPRDLIWPANVRWPQGQKLLLSSGNNEIDFVEAYFDGTDFIVLKWDLNLS